MREARRAGSGTAGRTPGRSEAPERGRTRARRPAGTRCRPRLRRARTGRGRTGRRAGPAARARSRLRMPSTSRGGKRATSRAPAASEGAPSRRGAQERASSTRIQAQRRTSPRSRGPASASPTGVPEGPTTSSSGGREARTRSANREEPPTSTRSRTIRAPLSSSRPNQRTIARGQALSRRSPVVQIAPAAESDGARASPAAECACRTERVRTSAISAASGRPRTSA